MSRLNFIGRPWIAFDASNRQHRQWYYEFVKHRTWGRCPVRFIVADDHGDLLTIIQQKLNQYYTEREFGSRLAR
jgi:hypothetical protein